ncbi:hypothetical protein ARALYDRAFT_359032 [Arabidopsis lyrata subsp. lyrata]|uniref:F-box associated beta-propeller type 3 domain-containing protein n=1 Tax=Arabidopsis lyrata subsp. lyrata TaxID=81972 RepID=D7MVD9_ARALL|nr:hypothetical protein ARALYDRAFT_359032 [Arabidopsis lyrata subsp. lyrata]
MQIDPSRDKKFSCGYASGLIYFYSMWINLKDDYDEGPVICNPNTGQYAILPSLERGVERFEKAFSFFGFDPIDKQYKVLKPHQGCGGSHKIVTLGNGCCCDHKIVTLGTGKMRWRTIKCPLPHDPDNHIGWKDHVDAIELNVWILEDDDKQEWSKYTYALWDDKFFVDDEKYAPVVVVGVTSTGEIILSMGYYTSDQPFYVFYFNPKKNTIQRVEIRGLEECDYDHLRNKVYTFVDHVEDLNVNDSKLLNSSIYAPYVKTKEEEKDEE